MNKKKYPNFLINGILRSAELFVLPVYSICFALNSQCDVEKRLISVKGFVVVKVKLLNIMMLLCDYQRAQDRLCNC